MASISAAITLSRRPSVSTSLSPLASPARVKRAVGISFKCWSGPSPRVDPQASEKGLLWGIPTSNWCAGVGALGFLETGYLTYLKLTNSEAFCPVGGGSCSDVLNSDYSYVLGVPLPLIGMAAYGLVALLSLQQTRKNVLFGLGENNVRLILLGTTTSMATASAFFLYLLSTKLAGTSCSYCLMSATLSFILFFITLKDFGLEEVQKVVGLQLAIAAIIVTALSNSYMLDKPQFSGSSDILLEPYETEITNQSTPFAISLAKHLHSIGAKMYGAFWCSHCIEQKQMFGREAAKLLDYVECFPDGAGKGRKMSLECTLAGIEGFPKWIIGDQVLSGEQELSALAEASRFLMEESPSS